MRLTPGSASDVGQLRSLNEDNLRVTSDLFAVADGMGGHRGGEVASARALDAFEAAAVERSLDALIMAVKAANRDVFEHARTSPDLTGMGTTLCAMAPLDGRHVGVVNVGDSRVYRCRDGQLFQLSEDHSFVESLVREGRLTRAQADVHPQRNVLTRALGIEPDVDVDGWAVAVRNGDRFLLCSDGLFNEVSDVDQQEILSTVADPIEAARRLVDAANAAGGRDNITCVVVDVSEVEDPPPGTDVADEWVGRPIDVASSGSTTDPDATSVDTPDLTARPTPPAPAAAPTPAPPKRRRFGWRTALFLGAIVATFGAALWATDYYYSSTYSVGVSGQKVVIFQGPDANFLWFERTTRAAEATVYLDDLGTGAAKEVLDEVPGLSLTEAEKYVARLRNSTTTSTASTTTTTSTVPDTTIIGPVPPDGP